MCITRAQFNTLREKNTISGDIPIINLDRLTALENQISQLQEENKRLKTFRDCCKDFCANIKKLDEGDGGDDEDKGPARKRARFSTSTTTTTTAHQNVNKIQSLSKRYTCLFTQILDTS